MYQIFIAHQAEMSIGPWTLYGDLFITFQMLLKVLLKNEYSLNTLWSTRSYKTIYKKTS